MSGKYITNDIFVSRFVIIKVGGCCACCRVFRQEQQDGQDVLFAEFSAIFRGWLNIVGCVWIKTPPAPPRPPAVARRSNQKPPRFLPDRFFQRPALAGRLVIYLVPFPLFVYLVFFVVKLIISVSVFHTFFSVNQNFLFNRNEAGREAGLRNESNDCRESQPSSTTVRHDGACVTWSAS